MGKFTTEEYIRKLNSNIRELQKINRPLALAASTAHDIYINRIFTDGKTASGGAIKVQGSTKTLRRGAYSRGYAQRRLKRGRQINFVNLTFEGLLFQNISNSLQRQGNTWVSGTTRAEESKKVNNLIKLYGEDVFILSELAKLKANEVAQKEYIKAMQ